MTGLLPPRRRPPRDDDARVLPMINVIFLLLVFFMVAGRLAPPPPFETVPLRADAGAPEPRTAEAPLVLIGADGALGFDGDRISREELMSRLGALAAGPGGVPVLRLQADARTETLRVADLMREMRANGVASFRLLVRRAAPGGRP